MEKNRLIAFGCSFTYGAGLPDCFDQKHQHHGPTPSKLGWVQLVADKLNLTAHNMGVPGASNLEILYNVLQFEFKKTDTVIIMWTFPNRDLFFKKYSFKYRVQQLGLWCTDKLSIRWMKSLDEYDQGVKSWINIHHADVVLKQAGVNYLHIPSHPRELIRYRPKFINIDNLDLDGLIHVDVGLDPHPGIESNKLTAEKIYNILCKN
jgi:hypothetical protein